MMLTMMILIITVTIVTCVIHRAFTTTSGRLHRWSKHVTSRLLKLTLQQQISCKTKKTSFLVTQRKKKTLLREIYRSLSDTIRHFMKTVCWICVYGSCRIQKKILGTWKFFLSVFELSERAFYCKKFSWKGPKRTIEYKNLRYIKVKITKISFLLLIIYHKNNKDDKRKFQENLEIFKANL